jgi:hypothetical protein
MFEVAFGVVVMLLVAAGYAARQSRMKRVEESLRDAGLQVERQGSACVGRWRDLVFSYRLIPGGRHSANRTHFEIGLPAGSPAFEMELRPQTHWELAHVEHGRAVDVELGDAQFDDAFIVEVAPADRAHRLLAKRTRSTLLGLFPCRLALVGHKLTFDKSGYLEEPGEVKRVVEACTEIVARIGTLQGVLAEQQLEAVREDASAGYRGPSPEAVRALATAPRGEEEIAALREARARRTAYQMKAGGALAVVAVAVMVILGVLGHC